MAPAPSEDSKFRNAIPSIPPTDTWYRSNLPSAASSNSTSSSLSTFFSEIKTNRRWIVTVTPNGDVSWRAYGDGPVGTMKVDAVGDWDLSGLEDETLVIGGTDGTLRTYSMPSMAGEDVKEERTISVGSPITTVCLHPTTPHLVLVAATQTPLSVYNVASESTGAAYSLEVEEPKGMWTAGWSNAGNSIAAVGRSGKGYVFDPRKSTKPRTTKTLPIQPLEPVGLVWVADKIFITGWDQSRNRLYALINPSDLSTVFTQNLDTNLSPLLPIVDEERKIVYIAGRGDMELRQVELGGVTGFQETVHPLPYALASTSLAAVHPTILDVMQAEIGRVLIPVVDKDGDAILPVEIKVPQRQSIDYHEDLYPDIMGSIPEQNAQAWLAGEDARPLPFTLDPAGRSTWEARLAQKPTTTSGSAPSATKETAAAKEPSPPHMPKTLHDLENPTRKMTTEAQPHPTFHSRVHIAIGDLVILYMTRDVLKAITITPGEVFHNKFGRYPHESLVGVKFGSKIHSPPPHAGYLYVLRPTPELWTLSLPHRTQILYSTDIAYITMRLGVRPGGKVLEAGTGSGSMTHCLSRSVGEKGKVLSYEYHEPRYLKAKEEFEGHGLRNVDLSHRNVCKDGFGNVEGVEAVFLDLPAPWEAVPYATKIMRPDIITRICCFSPCLEQVLRTVTTLRDEGYSDISTQEVLVRTHDLAQPPGPALSSVTAIVERLQAHEARKEERRVLQMKTARERSAKIKEKEAKGLEEAGVQEKCNEKSSNNTAVGEKRGAEESEPTESKKPRLDQSDKPSPRVREQSKIQHLQSLLATPPPTRSTPTWTEPEAYPSTTVLTKPSSEMRGHTSYLTFATLHPLSIRTEVAPLTKSRVDLLKEKDAEETTEGSEYGSEGLEEVMRTMTEEEMLSLAAV